MNHTEFKAERQRKGLSQRELAAFLGASYSAVTKWETNNNPIPKWVEEKMTDRRKSFPIDGLTAAEADALAKRAAAKGMSADSLAAELIRSFLKLSLLVAPAFYFAPSATARALKMAVSWVGGF